MAESVAIESSSGSLNIRDKLRPRKRKDRATSTSGGGESLEPTSSKIPRTSSHDNKPRPSGNDQLICSLKTCSLQCIDPSTEARVEIQISLTDKGDLKKLIHHGGVAWNREGEAIFHDKCWEVVRTSSKSRAKTNAAGLTPSEKTLVKEAAKTLERHSSLAEVKREAAKIAELIKTAKHCVAFTGAGISTSAGIGDYRGKGGKWTEMDRKEVTEKVSCDLKSEVPVLVRRQSSLLSDDGTEGGADEEGVPYEQLRPTYTHEALVKLVDLGFLKYVISQNGDGLHGLSGIPDDHLSELHGNVFVEVCEGCGHRYHRPYYVMDDRASQYYEDLEEYGSSDVKKPPHATKCRQCGLCHRTGRRCDQPGCRGFLKDSIINFGDDLEEGILTRAEEHAEKADVMISLGSTMQVTPACHLVVKNRKVVRLVIVNRQTTEFDEICYERAGSGRAEPRGSRVFGDCDTLMREVMRCLLSEGELREWEEGRKERLKQYNSLRNV